MTTASASPPWWSAVLFGLAVLGYGVGLLLWPATFLPRGLFGPGARGQTRGSLERPLWRAWGRRLGVLLVLVGLGFVGAGVVLVTQ